MNEQITVDGASLGAFCTQFSVCKPSLSPSQHHIVGESRHLTDGTTHLTEHKHLILELQDIPLENSKDKDDSSLAALANALR